MIKIKRIYEPLDQSDGCCILVDRLWPRGISKKEAKVDLWLKDIGPSNELRKWFGHDPNKFHEFRKRYLNELKGKPELISRIEEMAREENITLVYSAKDEQHNQAVILKEYLEKNGKQVSNYCC